MDSSFPLELLTEIFLLLDIEDIARLKLVCLRFQYIPTRNFWKCKFQSIDASDPWLCGKLRNGDQLPNLKIKLYLKPNVVCLLRNVLLKTVNMGNGRFTGLEKIISCKNSFERHFYHGMAQFFGLESYTRINHDKYVIKITNLHRSKISETENNLGISGSFFRFSRPNYVSIHAEPIIDIVITSNLIESKKIEIGIKKEYPNRTCNEYKYNSRKKIVNEYLKEVGCRVVKN